MFDQAALSRALAAAVGAGGPDAALAVCRACVEWLPMTGAAITVMAGADRQEPVCATNATAARIDELQFSLADGPCVESFTTGRAVLVADIADPAEGRWPIFAEAAADTGARGMFVFPLGVGAARLGVLDCYRDTPGGLSELELGGALRAADAAVWALLERVEVRPPAAEPAMNGAGGDQWYEGAALAHAEVHQATGMLMASARLGAPAALAQLRAVAFAQGRGITEVAVDVLARRLWLDPDGYWHPGSDNLPGDEPALEDAGDVLPGQGEDPS